MIDTIRLGSPSMPELIACAIEKIAIERSAVDHQSGEILYRFVSKDLDGSWDSNISVQIKRKKWIYDRQNKNPIQVQCEPYLEIEASAFKVLFGQNVYGALDDFHFAAEAVIGIVRQILLPDLPDYDLPSSKFWTVHRVDFAKNFYLRPEQIKETFRRLQMTNYPRRGIKTHSTTSFSWGGTTTYNRLYHKGAEFKIHDYNRLNIAFEKLHFQPLINGSITHDDFIQKQKKFTRKLNALQKMADCILRAETQINSKKLIYDFKEKNDGDLPTVTQITKDYLNNIYQNEWAKIMKTYNSESDLPVVADFQLVKNRIQNSDLSKRLQNQLLASYLLLSAQGEIIYRESVSKSVYYRTIALFKELNIDWQNHNIAIVNSNSFDSYVFLPRLDSKNIQSRPIRSNSYFNQCPVEQHLLKQAA